MLDGQSTDGKNIVVWYANRLLHHPRDEDGSRMPIEWMSFELAPRNFLHDDVLEPPPGAATPARQRHPHVPVPPSDTPRVTVGVSAPSLGPPCAVNQRRARARISSAPRGRS